MGAERPLLCPSAEPRAGHLVIGVVQSDGSVAHLRTPLLADQPTVAPDPEGRSADQRLRFAAPCQTSGCQQWSQGRCSVPGKVALILSESRTARPADHPEGEGAAEPLPRCAIRARCRWFAESGADACRICPLVVRRGADPVTTEVPAGTPARPQ